jgi:hypothetical protein
MISGSQALVQLGGMNMFKPNLPAVTTLESNDDDQLAAELRLARLRTEVAVVRTLADQVELLVSSRHADRLSEQLTEEMAKLGCLLFEAAAGLSRSPAPEDTGVFRRPAMRTT